MHPKRKTSGSAPAAKKKFVWSDDEVELLLNIAADYKASKAVNHAFFAHAFSVFGIYT